MTIRLVVDTCALLDLIRGPVRADFHPSYAVGARELLAAVRSQKPPARIICTDLVLDEYGRHVADVTEETKRLLTQIRDRYRQALEVIGGISAEPIPMPIGDTWMATAVQYARQLADQFVDVATIEAINQDDQHRATQRVFKATPPSRRGKDSLADCAITEVALRLAGAGTVASMRTVFFSSNTQEYCEGGKLKTVLQTEFDACGLEYVRSWGEARRAVLGRAT